MARGGRAGFNESSLRSHFVLLARKLAASLGSRVQPPSPPLLLGSPEYRFAGIRHVTPAEARHDRHTTGCGCDAVVGILQASGPRYAAGTHWRAGRPAWHRAVRNVRRALQRTI